MSRLLIILLALSSALKRGGRPPTQRRRAPAKQQQEPPSPKPCVVDATPVPDTLPHILHADADLVVVDKPAGWTLDATRAPARALAAGATDADGSGVACFGTAAALKNAACAQRAVAVEAPGAARGNGADEFVRRRRTDARSGGAARPARGSRRAARLSRATPSTAAASTAPRPARSSTANASRSPTAVRAPLPADMAFLEDADARRDLRRDGSTTCFREVHGAADGAPPNLAVDRYGRICWKWLAYEAKSLAYNGVANPTVDVGGRPFPKHDAIYGDCFAWLRRLANRGETFDVVMLDPPSTSTVNGKRWSAQRDYGALAALCAPLVNPDGGLLCCTTNARKLRREIAVCSAALDDAADRGLSIVLDRVVPPAVDYPVLAGQSPEVKNLVFRFERR
ncbi:S-adenosylmethionine-dependent methyltransferase [Aureococcus anophagefferens]|nr:S-adenosylmethionine-dependent methyltransferase [Aureococcus anophagefferens]